MPTNNPTPQTSSPSGSRIGTEHSSSLEGRVERGSERVERGIEQLANTAADRVREARQQATSGLTEQRDMVAKRIRRLSGVLRAGSDSIAADDPFAQNLLDAASDRIERFADYVSHATPNMLSDDVQRVARRRPGLFFGGAFLLGLALGRFVRSSTSARTSEEFDIDLEDDIAYSASRYERPYPGRPLSSTTSPTSEAAAPGTGATASPYTTPPRPYTNNPVPPSTTAGSATGTSTTGASFGTRPNPSSLSGSAGGSGTLPPPPYAGSTSSGASTGTPSNPPVRTQSTSPVGNAASNEAQETQRGQGTKS